MSASGLDGPGQRAGTVYALARRAVRMIVAAAALLSGAAASAHHGFSGRYDVSKPLWIEGEVTKAYFGQPHAELGIRTPADLGPPQQAPELAGGEKIIRAEAIQVRPDTRGRVVEVELPPTRAFFDLRDAIKVGDRVAVIAIRNCDAPYEMYTQWIRAPGGAVAAQTLRLSFMLPGC